MLPIYLCDDNTDFLKLLQTQIENIIMIENLDMKIKGVFTSPKELLSKISTKEPALYFLDLEFHHIEDGLTLACDIRKIDPRGFIVFVTAHSEAVPLTFSYKTEAMDYIVKDDISNLKERIRHCLTNALERFASPENHIHATLTCKVGDSVKNLLLHNIISIQSSHKSHKTQIFTTSGMLEVNHSMKELFESLDSRFLYAHRSCIVNINHILEYNANTRSLTLSDGRNSEISYRCQKNLTELFADKRLTNSMEI